MALEVFVGQTPLPTDAVGTTDLTSPDSTTVPVGAIHTRTKGITNGTLVQDFDFSVGMSDGTLSRSISSTVNSDQTVDDASKGYHDAVVSRNTAGSNIQDGDVSHNAFIAGGQRVNDVQAFPLAHLCNHMFFAGCNATVKEVILNATVDTAVNTDPGHAWDVAIVLHCRETVLDDGDPDNMASLGFMTKADDKQACICTVTNNGDASPGNPGLRISNTYSGMRLNEETGALIFGIDVQAGSVTSADVFPRIAGGESNLVAILFLGFTTGESALIFESASPASLGNRQDTIGGTLVPIATIDLISRAASYDVSETDAEAGVFGIGFSSDDSQFCSYGHNEFATGGNSNARGQVNNVSIDVGRDDGNKNAGNAYLESNV